MFESYRRASVLSRGGVDGSVKSIYAAWTLADDVL